MKHLLAAISPHGYGHLGMVAPVLNVLLQQHPNLQLTIRSTLPPPLLQRKIHGDFVIQNSQDDFGMLQSNSLHVERDASCRRYRDFHKNWDQHIGQCVDELVQAAPDVVFANVPYLTLAAAKHADIPAVGFSCLNWYDITRYYCRDEVVLKQMLDAYNSAEAFITPEPTMPTTDFTNLVRVGLVTTVGVNRRQELNQHLQLKPRQRLIVVLMGGITHHNPLDSWQLFDNDHLLVTQQWQSNAQNVTTIESLSYSVTDLIASADLVITKPGYGITSETAATGTPMLYIARPDWPEQPYIIEWMQQHMHCHEISESAFNQGDFKADMELLLEQGRSKPVHPHGVQQIVDYLLTNY